LRELAMDLHRVLGGLGRLLQPAELAEAGAEIVEGLPRGLGAVAWLRPVASAPHIGHDALLEFDRQLAENARLERI
jgi:hypothetical protein